MPETRFARLLAVDLPEQEDVEEENVTGRFQCHMCNKVIFSTKAVQLHTKKYHGCNAKKRTIDGNMKCDFCSGLVKEVHYQRSIKKQPRSCCRTCNKMLHGKSADERLELRDLAKDLAPGYICPKCGQFFSSTDTLQNHIEMHLSNKKAVYVCSMCQDRFVDIEELSQHLSSSHQNELVKCKVIRCEVCDKTLSKVKKYKKHYRKRHSDQNGGDGLTENKDSLLKLICMVCEGIFYNGKMFDNHQFTHQYQRYECDLCPDFFKSLRSRKRHISKYH